MCKDMAGVEFGEGDVVLHKDVRCRVGGLMKTSESTEVLLFLQYLSGGTGGIVAADKVLYLDPEEYPEEYV
jgi:hypothetical protein